MTGCTASVPALTAQQSNQGQQPVAQGQQQQDPLGLSQEQQQKLASVFQALAPDEKQQQEAQKLRDALLADQVDVDAVVSSLESSRQSLIQNVDKVISMFQNLRETLDVNQRNKLVAILQQQTNQEQQLQFPSELKLTKAQQDALSSLKPAQLHINDALKIYLQTGDDNALRQAITADIAAMPQPQVIANALASLNKDQRQQMFGDQD
jgi:hypothetical protein